MLRYQILILLVLLSIKTVSAQQDSTKKINLSIENRSGISSTTQVPFWLRANQYGDIPPAGAFTGINLRLNKAYKKEFAEVAWNKSDGAFDWKANFESTAYAAEHSKARIIEANAAIRYRIFEVKAGRSKEVMGLNGDTTLSSGNFAVSGNALGIPKVEISVPNYWKLPFWDGLIAIKGNFAHGWMGHLKILDKTGGETRSDGTQAPIYTLLDSYPATYFHQKSFYGRIGKENWRLKLYGGFSHQVQWGNEQKSFQDFGLNSLETFAYVALGLPYETTGFPKSKIGNQLGSIDLALEYRFKQVKVKIYRQNFYDVGALYYLANIRDGLNGITLTNLKPSSDANAFQWKALTAEIFYSVDQAGYPWSKLTRSGDEDYYNNYYYKQGWSYLGEGLGNPLITPAHYARPGQLNDPADYFINNRVFAIHGAISGSWKSIGFTAKGTLSKNYGTFSTSPYGKSTGSKAFSSYGLFQKVTQLSLGLMVNKSFNNGWYGGLDAGLDFGKLLPQTYGTILHFGKHFN